MFCILMGDGYSENNLSGACQKGEPMHALLIRHVFAGGFSFLLGLYLVPIVIKAALKIGFVDAPDGKLKHQKQPVAYLGGVGVFIPFITTLGLCYPFDNMALWLLLGTTLLLFVGLIDDLKVLKPHQKFFGQCIAALCFLKGEFSLKTPFFMATIANMAASLFWMLTVINAFNLVDVMDGLCGTLALCSAGIFLVCALAQGAYGASLLLTAFIGATAGFLVYNRPHAKIYLGDAGSMFIGGFLAAIPLFLSWGSPLFPSLATSGLYQEYALPLLQMFFIPALVLAIPLVEVLGLFVIRTRLGIPFYNGSPHHFAIYLQKRGWSKWRVLSFAALCSVATGVLAIGFALQYYPFLVVIKLLALGVAAWVLTVFVLQ
ncbi:undecaprenyl/decaprenyl-phosphate alpha-N-acetylglucosaminyl 1-phosphate transferase [bacterium]|nr:undecaprenyl/decaprenyl-phosphate alpha-N-acetylglucosaminyl 1-phosphate transferase [bacterium]